MAESTVVFFYLLAFLLVYFSYFIWIYLCESSQCVISKYFVFAAAGLLCEPKLH